MSAAATSRSRDSALGGLLARYAQVLAFAWRERRQLAPAQRNADELAFLPAALSLQDTPVHPAPRRAAWLSMLLFALAILWATFGKVDIVAVAPGRIIVGERTKLIQPLERSVVKRVLVKDGDHVDAGQALVELDPTGARADATSVREQIKSARSETQRAQALLQALKMPAAVSTSAPVLPVDSAGSDPAQGPPPWSATERGAVQQQLATEWDDIAARMARFAAEAGRRQAEISTAREMVDRLEATLPLVRRREDDIRALSAQGFIASHAGQDRTRERIELERDLATQRARQQETLAALRESESGRMTYLAQTRRNLSDRQAQAELRLHQASQEYAKAVQREKLTVLTAPVSGVVQQLAVHTAGGVVTEAQPLMVIVPNDDAPGAQVVAEVTLENKDIGFVNAGQSAEVKLETFVFTRYGTIPATVQLVTADAVTDDKRGAVFPARIVLSRRHIDVDGKQIRLGPGMNVTAEIKTGQRRVIAYLLSPIQRVGGESLRER